MISCASANSCAPSYDGIELAPFTLGDEPHLLSTERRAEIKRIAADAGVAITGLHCLMVAPKGLSITAADANVRRSTLAVIRGLCDLAANLGAPILIHGSPAQRQLEPGREGEGRKRGIECMAAAAAAAENAGVAYLLEPLAREDTGFINTVEEAVAVVRAIGSPALRTMLDCSAAGRAEAEPIPDVLRRWLPTGLVTHIHLNDPNRRGPGEGALAFAPILAALEANGYAGMAAIEPFIYEPDGPSCAARAIGYMRGLQEVRRTTPRNINTDKA